MILILMFLMIVMMINFIISLMIIMINKKQILDTQKSSPFECGFNPMTRKRLPFSIHFFLIAVIFLIFDIEIIIILPMILTLKSSQLTTWLLTSTMFILILILGLYHEWMNGMLNWTK
uniref:NADH-ubiquinone oxidoreductase chain 3 n=1 Tax=Empoascanara plamka TaxID=2906264 RepID=A0AA51RI59_9HEMI|nr:NADH dehydrogenase subunit 3 [Empoascanara plamka]WMQ52367.1 NADH dehydrogenase subunit 3 [Empoascanara plamka]